MKFTCLQENLRQGLQIAKQSGSRHTTLPILQNYLIQVYQGTLTITSTNLEIGIRAMVRGKEESEGTITVPQERLLAYIKNLPQDKIDLSSEETTLHVSSGTEFSADFHGMESSEFPELPVVEPTVTLTVSVSELKQALKLASVSLPKNDFRPEISGVYIAKKGQTLVFVGTDGFRLSEKTLQIPSLDEGEFGFIVPSKTVSECIRILDTCDDEEVSLGFGQLQMSMALSQVEVVSKLVEGRFPQYEGLIPSEFSRSFSVDKDELIQAIRLSSVFAADSVNDIKFTSLDASTISVQSSSSEIGANDAHIKCQLTGEPGFEIAFNYTYILDGLASLSGDVVTFSLNDSDSPAILRGTDDPDFFYLVMPIRE